MLRYLALLAALLISLPLAEVHAQSMWSPLRDRESRPRAERPPAQKAPVPPTQAAPAAAPAAPKAQQATPAAAPPQPPPGPAPYEKDMQRLSEILGALHYLRPLCGAADGQVWRDKMRDLMDAEGGPTERKERFAGAFNGGYNSFKLTYRTCTPSADLAVRLYLAEGSKLSRDIATRHGN